MMKTNQIIISEEDLKCLQTHLKPLTQLLNKLKKGADNTAPVLNKKPESKKQGINRMMQKIEERQSKELNR